MFFSYADIGAFLWQPFAEKAWRTCQRLAAHYKLPHFFFVEEAPLNDVEGWYEGKNLLERLEEAYGDKLEPEGELRKRYEFRDDTAVEGFLGENPFLIDLLIDAYDRIQEYFGSNTPVALDVLREPDAKNGGRLFILILTELLPKEAMSRLDELDQGWWVGELSAAQGKVTIDIDYG